MRQRTGKNRQKGFIFMAFVIAAGIFALLGAAGWATGLNFAERIGYSFFILLFSIIAGITTTFASFASWYLQIVISPDYTSLSYTNPAGNPVIEVGLSVTQGFANMILVLVLVFIALATILRLAGYETKKLVPTFILVALLVNFAPVVVGLVVDASNIIMNYFISGLFQFAVISAELNNLWQGLISLFTGTIDQVRAVFFYSVAVAAFGFFLGLAYLIYAFIFMIRYIAIWALTILAPLAFVFYILPATRGITKKWWEQLVQWSFIGVTAGFFLYLASHVAAGARNWFAATPTAGSEEIGPISILLVYLVPLAFLYLGLALGMATSAIGASAAIKMSTRTQKWVGARAGKGIGKWAEERYDIRGKVGKVLTGGTFSEDNRLWQRLGIAGKKMHGLQEIPGLRAMIPEAVKEFPYVRKPAEAARAKLTHLPSPEIVRQLVAKELHGPERVAALNELVERDDTSDYFDQWGRKIFGLARWNNWRKEAEEKGEGLDYQMEKLMTAQALKGEQGRLGKRFLAETQRDLNMSFRGGLHKGVIRGSPRMGAMAAGSKIPGFDHLRPGADWKEGVRLAIKQTRPSNVPHWEREEFMMDENIDWLMEKGNEFWGKAMDVKEAPEQATRTVARLLKSYVPDFATRFPDTAEGGKELWTKFETQYKAKHEGQSGFFSWELSGMARRSGVTKEAIMHLARHPKAPPPAAPGAPPGGGTPPTMPPRGRPGPGRPTTPGYAAGLEQVAGTEEEQKMRRPPRGRPGMGGP